MVSSSSAADPLAKLDGHPEKPPGMSKESGSKDRLPESSRPAAIRKKGVGSFLAGALSGTVMGAALQPFDVIRTQLQAQMAQGGKTTMGATARHIIATSGVRGLWRGVGPTCIRIGFGAGIYFAALDSALQALRQLQPFTGARGTRRAPSRGSQEDARQQQQQQQQLPHVLTFSAGLVSRSLAVVLLCPVTVVKTRMEMGGEQGMAYRGTWSGIASIARKEGLGGLFKGLGPTWARDAPYSGLYLVLYSTLRTALLETPWDLRNRRPHSSGASASSSSSSNSTMPAPSQAKATAATFAAGALSGALATVLTHPPDVIRTRIQLDMVASTGASTGALRAMPSFVSAAASIWKTYGVRGFFAGVAPRVIKRSIQQALGWAVFERATKLIIGRTIWEKEKPVETAGTVDCLQRRGDVEG